MSDVMWVRLSENATYKITQERSGVLILIECYQGAKHLNLYYLYYLISPTTHIHTHIHTTLKGGYY